MREPRLKDQVDDATERRLRRFGRERWRAAIFLALAVMIGDQIVKEVVRSNMYQGQKHPVLTGFDIHRVTNEGIAFGLFPGNTTIVATLTVIALVAIAIAMAKLAQHNTLAAIGGGLLLGGAAGNLIDRLIHGGVTDYLSFAYFPAFNVADIGITLGAGLMVLGVATMVDDTSSDSEDTG